MGRNQVSIKSHCMWYFIMAAITALRKRADIWLSMQGNQSNILGRGMGLLCLKFMVKNEEKQIPHRRVWFLFLDRRTLSSQIHMAGVHSYDADAAS